MTHSSLSLRKAAFSLLGAVLALYFVFGPHCSQSGVEPALQREREVSESLLLAEPLEEALVLASVDSDVREQALPQEQRVGDDVRPSEESIQVLSTRSIPLQMIEYSIAEGSWMEAELDGEQRWKVSPTSTRQVRAPGHLAGEFALGDREIMLEPEYAVLLRAEGLRAKIREVRFGPVVLPAAQTRTVSAGFIDVDNYAFAISKVKADGLFSLGLEVEIYTTNYRLLGIEPKLESGGVHELDIASLLPLQTPSPGRFLASCLHPSARATFTLRGELISEPATTRADYPWGRLSAQYFGLEDQLEGAAGEVLVTKPLSAGERHRLTAKCARGCFGVTYFVHDEAGKVTELQLEAGVTLKGTVHALEGAQHPESVRIDFAFAYSPEDLVTGRDQSWNGRKELPLSASQEFTLVLPDELPVSPRAIWPMPRFVRLTLRSKGFESAERWLDLRSETEVQVGVIELAQQPPDLVLAAGHGLDLGSLRDEQVQSADAAHVRAIFAVQEARELADGRLYLYLRKADNWRDEQHAYLVVTEDIFGAKAFTLGPSGEFNRLPERTTQLEVRFIQFPLDCDTVYLGWTWNGVQHTFDIVSRASLDKAQEYSLSLPEGPLDLWWSSEHHAPTEALGASMGAIVAFDPSVKSFLVK